MSLRHFLLAIGVIIIWGLSFVVVRWGLAGQPPLAFASLRFASVAIFAPVLARPAVSGRALLAYGIAWGSVQFGAMFVAIALGVPAGAASLVMQGQVLFTTAFAIALGLERPAARQAVVMALAVTGLVILAGAVARHAPIAGFVAAVIAAAGMAAGNVLGRRFAVAGIRIDTFAFLSWSAVVPAITLAAMSSFLEGPRALAGVIGQLSARSAAALAYQAGASLVLGSMAWNALLRRYRASSVAPLALLVPVVSVVAGHMWLGEVVTGTQLLGGLLLCAAVAVATLRSSGQALRHGSRPLHERV